MNDCCATARSLPLAARDLMGWPRLVRRGSWTAAHTKKKESSQKNSSGAHLYAELSPADFVAISVGQRSATECSEPDRDASVNGPSLLATEDIAAEN